MVSGDDRDDQPAPLAQGLDEAAQPLLFLGRLQPVGGGRARFGAHQTEILTAPAELLCTIARSDLREFAPTCARSSTPITSTTGSATASYSERAFSLFSAASPIALGGEVAIARPAQPRQPRAGTTRSARAFEFVALPWYRVARLGRARRRRCCARWRHRWRAIGDVGPRLAARAAPADPRARRVRPAAPARARARRAPGLPRLHRSRRPHSRLAAGAAWLLERLVSVARPALPGGRRRARARA